MYKQPPHRTLQEDYISGPMVILGGGTVSYERGTPVQRPFVVRQHFLRRVNKAQHLYSFGVTIR